MSQESHNKPTGNTKNRCLFQRYVWCFTLKSEGIHVSQVFQVLHDISKKFTFQLEQGESGYEHYQGAFSLKNKEYFETVKGFFPACIHLEGAKDGFACFKYACKSETRIAGPWTETSVFMKTISTLYSWQAEIRNELLEEPDDRTINWIWEDTGNTGKTQFCKYMHVHHKASFFQNAKTADIAYAIDESTKIVLFNIPRSSEEYFNYSALECLKDGIIFSSKYESGSKCFDSPHVYVFANFRPNLETMSKDRWRIRYITQDFKLIEQ
nr:MAG: replication associated protein [Cressdnaviricota sp.]